MENSPTEVIKNTLVQSQTPLNRCVFVALIYENNPSLGKQVLIRKAIAKKDGGDNIPKVESVQYLLLCREGFERDFHEIVLAEPAVMSFIEKAAKLTAVQKVGVQSRNLLNLNGKHQEKYMVYFCLENQGENLMMGPMNSGKIVNPREDSESGRLLKNCEMFCVLGREKGKAKRVK